MLLYLLLVTICSESSHGQQINNPKVTEELLSALQTAGKISEPSLPDIILGRVLAIEPNNARGGKQEEKNR